MRLLRCGAALLTSALAACSSTTGPPGAAQGGSGEVRRPAPALAGQRGVVSAIGLEPGGRFVTRTGAGSPVDLSALPAFAPEAVTEAPAARPVERPISEVEAARLRDEALSMPRSAAVQSLTAADEGALAAGGAPTPGTGFEGPDIGECCGGLFGAVPPDPELAVGPNHVIAVVNVALAVYDKNGALLAGPIPLDGFFDGTPGCDNDPVGSFDLFDPNVVYDEEADRFVLGADGDGTSYCVAASAGPDPTGVWNRYGFATEPIGSFFDFPHAGVGREAVFVGANIFAGAFLEGRVYAIDRAALYAGTPLTVVSRSTGRDSTPQPANLHGFLQGTWPLADPHYVLTEVFDGARHSVWSWADPFGADVLTRLGDVDLNAATGVVAGFPILATQDGPGVLESNDWRGLDAEYRNGRLWMTNSIACDPDGSGPVDCVRWAEIDPAGPSAVQAGVFASPGVHRIFPDLAANHCGDMAVGYTRTGPDSFPAAWYTGRRSADPAATVQPDAELKAGEQAYTAFDGSPYRWGDYSGMTVAPDGLTFWYLGEYSKSTGSPRGDWGTYVGSFYFTDCSTLTSAPDVHDFGAVEVWDTSPPQQLVLTNTSAVAVAVTGIAVSDPTNFFVDENGGASPCGSRTPVLGGGASCTLTVTFSPRMQQFFAETLEIATGNPANTETVPLAAAGYHPCPFAPVETLAGVNPEPNDALTLAACLRVEIGPWQVGPGGRLSVTAGESVVFFDGAEIAGELAAGLDPFLALP